MAAAGLVTALSCVLLYLINVLPVMRYSLLFLVSLLPVILAHEKRWADALLAYAASSLLSGFLFPGQGAWILYAAFFGWYGILREYLTGKLNLVLSWVVLIVAFNAAFLPVYYLASQLLPITKLPAWLMIPAGEAAFVAFELVFGLCREYYIRRIRARIPI